MMMQRYVKLSVLLCLLLTLALNGCGRKQLPQVTNDTTVMPQISDLSHEITVNVLRMEFTPEGDAQGVGFQIDRTEMDPYCKCPGFWRRFYERPALARYANKETYKLITLKTKGVPYLFRIRAVDAAGNLGPWSKLIHARFDGLKKQ